MIRGLGRCHYFIIFNINSICYTDRFCFVIAKVQVQKRWRVGVLILLSKYNQILLKLLTNSKKLYDPR